MNDTPEKGRYDNLRNLTSPERSVIIVALRQFAESRRYSVAKGERHRAMMDSNAATADDLAQWLEGVYPVTLSGSRERP